MNKILKSASVIAFVAAIAVGATSAYFSDTETSANNTITAGTIDIELSENGIVTTPYTVADIKPGETGYMTMDVKNVGTNPVKVSKSLWNFDPDGGAQKFSCTITKQDQTSIVYSASSEPECVAEQTLKDRVDNLRTQILYDLSVKVYEKGNETTPVQWQTIYTGAQGQTLSAIYPGTDTYVALGTIPVGGHMVVTQSYHFNYDAGNEYQGDVLKFDITIKGEQLTGNDGMASVVLENKTLSGGDWVISSTDNIAGTLKYETNGSKFVYNFSGVAPAAGNYVLAIGLNSATNVDTYITDVTAGSGGVITTVNGSIELGKDMMGVKAWLVPKANWVSNAVDFSAGSGWPAMVGETLWETSLVWYNDTNN